MKAIGSVSVFSGLSLLQRDVGLVGGGDLDVGGPGGRGALLRPGLPRPLPAPPRPGRVGPPRRGLGRRLAGPAAPLLHGGQHHHEWSVH